MKSKGPVGLLSDRSVRPDRTLTTSRHNEEKEEKRKHTLFERAQHQDEDRQKEARPAFLFLRYMSAEEQPGNDWYETWFDSPYYHILYKDRDEQEAAFFVDRLVDRLKALKGDRILDLACGKGRHAVQLHRKGFDVTGVDLSSNSIEEAKAYEAPGLRFDVHDMRHVYDRNQRFDKILNLFSSFGYFRSEGENFRVIKAASEQLREGGELVIDFMNAQKEVQGLVPHEIKTVEGIDFHIDRYVEYGILVKRIAFHDEGKGHEFKEKLRILFDNDLQVMLERAGMQIIDRYGDYALKPFDPRSSERLIIVARKKAEEGGNGTA